MNLQFWCKTDKGLRRENNQDSYLVNQNLGLFIVADGMGGHQGGEVASALAVQTLEDVIGQNQEQKSPRDLLMQAYSEASRRIFDKASQKNADLFGMGTTMVAAYVKNNMIYLANVGDSRAYLYKNPYVWQLTEDHSLVNEQLRAGIIKDHQVNEFASKNVITRSVGFEREVQTDILHREVFPGDMYILCSDGMSGLVSDEQLNKICYENPPSEVVDKCVDLALASGGHDNVTVLVLYFAK